MTDTASGRTTVAIPLFDRFTALDAIGPYEVLQRIPSVDVVFVGHETGEVRSDNRMLGITRDAVFEDVPAPEVLVFPGGFGTRVLETDDRVLGWVRSVHRTTTWTTSVCTGSLVLAAAGLLTGRTATTHWSTYAELERYGVTAVPDRVGAHPDDRLITAAGVSSGIDMALRLVELLVDRTAAEAAQLMIEYDPAPHVAAGSVAAASDETMTRVIEYASVGRH